MVVLPKKRASSMIECEREKTRQTCVYKTLEIGLESHDEAASVEPYDVVSARVGILKGDPLLVSFLTDFVFLGEGGWFFMARLPSVSGMNEKMTMGMTDKSMDAVKLVTWSNFSTTICPM